MPKVGETKSESGGYGVPVCRAYARDRTTGMELEDGRSPSRERRGDGRSPKRAKRERADLDRQSPRRTRHEFQGESNTSSEDLYYTGESFKYESVSTGAR